MKKYKIGDKVRLKDAYCCCSRSTTEEQTIEYITDGGMMYLLDDGFYHNEGCFAPDVPEGFKPVQIVLNLNTPEELMYVWGAFNSPSCHVKEMVEPYSNIIPDDNMQLPLFDAVDEAAKENGLLKD